MLRATPLINQVFTATAATSSSPPVRVAGCPLSAAGVRGSVAPPGPGVSSCHRPLGRGGGSPPPGRGAARHAMLAAAGGRRRGHLHGLKAKRLRPSVLFLAGSSGQRSSALPAGRAGRQAREDRASERASRQTGHRRSEVTAGRQAGGRAAASRAAERRRRPRPPPRRLRERQAAASGVPPLRPRLPSGWRLGARLLPRRLPRRSRGAPGPCRWPVPGWSWGGCSLLPTPPSPSWPSPRLRSGSR